MDQLITTVITITAAIKTATVVCIIIVIISNDDEILWWIHLWNIIIYHMHIHVNQICKIIHQFHVLFWKKSKTLFSQNNLASTLIMLPRRVSWLPEHTLIIKYSNQNIYIISIKNYSSNIWLPDTLLIKLNNLACYIYSSHHMHTHLGSRRIRDHKNVTWMIQRAWASGEVWRGFSRSARSKSWW